MDHEVFFACFATIQPWLDLHTLTFYLTKYGVVKNSAEMAVLTSSLLMPQNKMKSLIEVVEEAGSDGFMFLYMCLKESSKDNKGHEDAVQELDRCGMWMRRNGREGGRKWAEGGKVSGGKGRGEKMGRGRGREGEGEERRG